MDWKRLALVFGFVAVVIGLGFFIYFLFFSPTPSDETPQPPDVTTGTSTFPIAGIAQPGQQGQSADSPLPPTKVSGAQTAQDAKGGLVEVKELETRNNRSPQLSSDGKEVFTFDGLEGKFYRISSDGKATPLTQASFKGASTITWSPRSDRAVIEFQDGANIMYDFANEKQVTLPQHWEQFAFAPSGDKVAFKSMAPDAENRWLATANADGSAGRLIEPLGKKANQFDANWSPSDQIVGTFHEGIDGNRQRLYFIGFNGENFKSVVVNGRGLETQWSPKGDKMLLSDYSASSQYQPELWIVDALGESIGNNRRKIDLATWAHKCTFADQTTLYCAVPLQLPEGAGLLPSTVESPEALYRVDLKNGSRQKIAELPEGISTEKIVVTQDQSQLYINDTYTGLLHSVKLK